MQTIAGSALVLCAVVCLSASAAAQTPVGALAIDERRGDQYGWAVDYETAGAAGRRALSECGSGCSMVLTFERCAAYAADQDAGSTVYGWAESYDSASGARQRALAECGSRGSGCTVRVWGCNGPVVEDGLGLDRAARRQVQEGLQAAGFDPGGADGMFGPRTRSAIRSWQTSRGARATGYLDGASVAALRSSVAGQPTFRQREPAGAATASATTEQENLFWQSIAASTNPVEFEAYLLQFPNGVFRVLAETRLAVLRSPGGDAPASVGRPFGGVGSPAAGSRESGAGNARSSRRTGVGGAGLPGAGTPVAAGVDASPDAVFRPDQTCVGQPRGTSCWMEISAPPGCHVWAGAIRVSSSVTWTGECSGGLARGTGLLTWARDGTAARVDTGQIQEGKLDGYWVLRWTHGEVIEGPFVDGEANGHWIRRLPSGTVHMEGPYVDGEPHGEWVIRRRDGTVRATRRYENGEIVDEQMIPPDLR